MNRELLKDSYEVFVKAVLAGVMICFGCIVFMMCEMKIIGATLFSFGLLTIAERSIKPFVMGRKNWLFAPGRFSSHSAYHSWQSGRVVTAW